MVTSGLNIVSRVDDGVACLVVSGELDLATAPELVRRVERGLGGEDPPVELDLAGVVFVDGSGLRSLLAVQSGPDGQGGLELVRASRQVRRLFDLAGVPGRLATVDAVPGERE
jgi:anti-sigma B factor antagonist